jgi:broad specificity phosphatase PhoE
MTPPPEPQPHPPVVEGREHPVARAGGSALDAVGSGVEPGRRAPDAAGSAAEAGRWALGNVGPAAEAGAAAAGAPARLILLRHGCSAGAEARCAGRGDIFDPGLGPAGRAQAGVAVHRLGRQLDLVVSSPARRALETACLWGLPVRVDDRLAERSFGEWEGRPWAELWPTVPAAVLADPEAYTTFTPPGGEPLEAVADRVGAALRDLAAEPGRRVLAVTHAGPLRLAVGAVLGLSPGRALTLGADHAHAAVLDRYGDRWVLECLNC